MILFKAERQIINAILAFKKKNGRFPSNVEIAKHLKKQMSNISIYVKRLKKYLRHKKGYGSPIEIKDDYMAFFLLPEKEQEKIIDRAMRGVDNSDLT